jgi:hypothetical protein
MPGSLGTGLPLQLVAPVHKHVDRQQQTENSNVSDWAHFSPLPIKLKLSTVYSGFGQIRNDRFWSKMDPLTGGSIKGGGAVVKSGN